MLKPSELPTEYVREAISLGKTLPPASINIMQDIIAPSLDLLFKEDFPLPSVDAIKAKVPLFVAGGGGMIFDRLGGRKAEIPIYKCDGCR